MELVKLKEMAYNDAIKEKLDDAKLLTEDVGTAAFYVEDVDIANKELETKNAVEHADSTNEAYVQYLGAELLLPSGSMGVAARARG